MTNVSSPTAHHKLKAAANAFLEQLDQALVARVGERPLRGILGRSAGSSNTASLSQINAVASTARQLAVKKWDSAVTAAAKLGHDTSQPIWSDFSRRRETVNLLSRDYGEMWGARWIDNAVNQPVRKLLVFLPKSGVSSTRPSPADDELAKWFSGERSTSDVVDRDTAMQWASGAAAKGIAKNGDAEAWLEGFERGLDRRAREVDQALQQNQQSKGRVAKTLERLRDPYAPHRSGAKVVTDLVAKGLERYELEESVVGDLNGSLFESERASLCEELAAFVPSVWEIELETPKGKELEALMRDAGLSFTGDREKDFRFLEQVRDIGERSAEVPGPSSPSGGSPSGGPSIIGL